MRRISIQSVDMTNFKSFTSGHVDLRRGSGLRMVFGENRREPRLGANGCLLGGTLIDCPRDIGEYPRGVPLASLVGKQFYTYSWNEELQTLVLSWVSKVWKTGYQEVYRVPLTPYSHAQRRLGNRKGGITENQYLPPCELVGTYDHPVLLCDGSWKKLGELVPRDSLKSLYRSSGDDGRGQLRWSGQEPTVATSLGRRNLRQPMSYYPLLDGVSEYQFVCEAIHGERPPDTHVHHIDENSLNHSPDNLEWKDAHKHLSEHTSRRNREGTAGWKVSGVHPRGMLGKTHLPETIAVIAEASSKRERSSEERQKLSVALTGRVFTDESLQRMSEGQLRSPREACVYCGTVTNLGNLARWHNDNCSQKLQQVNHRVCSLPQLIGKRWVYDMHVEGTHNFVANGVFVHNSGKSTIFDAVEFCASGRSVRGRRASELVTTGQKSMVVETAYLIDDVEHRIRRTYAPERVYVDGEVAEQRQVDELLGLSRERRLASVLFGQARPLFMDMPAPERGDLLDSVLGLEFWMRAADLATQRWNKAGVEVQRIQRDLARLDGALEELPDEAELERLAEEHDARREEDLAALRDQRKVLDAEYRQLRRAAVAMGDTAGALDEAVTSRDVLRGEQATVSAELAVLRSDFDRLSKDIVFFEDTGKCPTCGQEISEIRADAHLIALRRETDEKSARLAEVIAAKNALDEKVRLASSTIATRQDEARTRRIADSAVVNKKGEISVVDNRITLVQGQPNPHREQAASAAERRATLEKQVGVKREEETLLSSRMGDLDFWRQGFRRVRIFCLSRVLRELEVETMSAARSLGLVGWHVGFTGETETKSGTVKLGVRAVVESPEAKRDFDAWSPGEGQRIRVASSLGLASLIQRYSGVVYDLEVWDEPSAWLSEEGIEDLFACLSERAHSRGKSIWICDPRAGIAHGVFDEVWNVVKDDDGSRVEVVRPDRLVS